MTPGTGAALSLRGMTLRIPHAHGGLPLVDDVSFSVGAGEILALVGESGSGKSLTGLAIAGLEGAVGAEIRTAGSVDRGGGRAGIVFQDAAAAINPVRTVGSQLREVVEQSVARSRDGGVARSRDGGVSRPRGASVAGGGSVSIEDRAVAALREVGLPDVEDILRAWPHQLSLGMLQRVQLALALGADPDILVADEPTSALDPILEAHILELLIRVTRDRGLATVLITHDLGAAARVSDRIAVMYAGRIMEEGPTATVLAGPAHPCTRALLLAMPDQVRPGEAIPVSPGRMPEPAQRDARCPFRDRCSWFEKACTDVTPARVGAAEAGHTSRCILPADYAGEGPGR